MNDYLIINLLATRAAGCLMYFGLGLQQAPIYSTPNHNDGLIVSEQDLNLFLDVYDNGTTTRAVLRSVVINKPWEVKNILLSITGKQENAA
ncbi:hypothetical protein [Nitrincola iocasae]|uniref:Uncharacterized protein n=1 Tax=Nitrincola iocasae TaxID=2614693 RepID=A0A5J6LAH7_9GAMM|nr:hypothetical protein [Nitrincola iocasae]QEW05624.1 hypothetical protein F5I99_03480 [Nitrincola iocasae]